MTDLRTETLRIPATELGPENPLPEFRSPDKDRKIKVAPQVPEEDRQYLGWQSGHRVMPHRLQDSYGAELTPTDFRVAVLENETLRATVLPAMGGRLLSLYHKTAGRELLENNPILRLGNLGLRIAWFSGGIEWNTAQPGHHYLTCSPMFAARISGSQGEPALRLYEWDRAKRFPWQIDLHLPPGSPFLMVHTRIVNPHDHEIPMYWWTNVAVPESPDTRVLAPATEAIRFDLELGFTLVDFAGDADIDHSYATRIAGSKDLFFRVPPERWPWMAALDGDGRGLFQTSTARLRGRKLFAWGNHQGGKRWQEFLGGPGRAYIEIQAGLTRTQAETIPMPGCSEWSWTEVFGLLEAPPGAVHAEDWAQAWPAAEEALRNIITPERVDELDADLAASTVKPPEEVLFQGSGWAALERRRAAAADGINPIPVELPFEDSSLGPDQQPWLELLEKGALPEVGPQSDPGHWMIQDEWAKMIEASIKDAGGDHWASWLHLGNARMESFDAEGARQAWQKSTALRVNGWALRNLAILEKRAANLEDHCRLLGEAWEAGLQILPLAVEYGRALLKTGAFQRLRDFVARLPREFRDSERVAVLDAWAALETGELGVVEKILRREFVYVREGFSPMTDLWFELHARKLAQAEGTALNDALRERARTEFPPPKSLDYRQKA